MCAHRPTPQSYTCRTPSRVLFTFQALLDYPLDTPHHRVCIPSFLVFFRVDYLALGFHQQHQRAVRPPLFGPWCTSESSALMPHLILDILLLIWHIYSLLSRVFLNLRWSLVKDHNISGPYNLSSYSLQGPSSASISRLGSVLVSLLLCSCTALYLRNCSFPRNI